jgi:hypothetical protein
MFQIFYVSDFLTGIACSLIPFCAGYRSVKNDINFHPFFLNSDRHTNFVRVY